MRRSCRSTSCRSAPAAQAVEHRGRRCAPATGTAPARRRASRPIMLRGMFLSFSLASSWTMTSPCLGLVPGEVVLGVLDEQRIDVDDMALDQQVVGPLPQLDQRPRDDVDEAPRTRGTPRCCLHRKAGRRCAWQLPRCVEAAHRVVAGADVRPACGNVELAFASGALGLHVHALQQIRIALGIEDDHDLVLSIDRAPDVLRDEQLGRAGLADARA